MRPRPPSPISLAAWHPSSYRLGEEEIHEIFRTATEGVLPRDQAAQLLSLLTGVENAKDVRDIMSAAVTVGAHVIPQGV
jgi:hypothetical protein